jgi:hypothetical protein
LEALMKLTKIELADHSAAVRIFPSKLIQLRGYVLIGDKKVPITDLDEDEHGNVWVNHGLYRIAAGALVYSVPADAEAEWAKRFDSAIQLPIGYGTPPPSVTRGEVLDVLAKNEIEAAVERWRAANPDTERSDTCPKCGKVCASAAGLAAHMRGAHK